MTIEPIGERVLLIPHKEAEKTKAGIYLPDEAREKKQGIVHAVGQLKDGKPIPLSKGDKVLYGGYSNEEFEYEGNEYVVVEYKDVLARIR